MENIELMREYAALEMENYGRFEFVNNLPKIAQDVIRYDLEKVVSGEDLEAAMNSRLIDLEDTINIDWYL